MFMWSTAAQVAVRMEAMRKAESGLVALARRFGDHEPSSYTMEVFDTDIPAAVLPFRDAMTTTTAYTSGGGWTSLLPFGLGGGDGKDDIEQEEEHLTMHAIRVSSSDRPAGDGRRREYPLVIVHGYMNGALYFYRNLARLAGCFDTVFSVDLLGWGLSSRPSMDRLKDGSVETAEDFFVESLEAWRDRNDLEKMILAGHSMGGYLSVAYCERYPDRVDQLLLLSPAGIPAETQADREERNARFLTSTPRRLLYGLFGSLWEGGYTPGSVMRTIPESRGRYLIEGYVRGRLPSIADEEERAVLSDYMYLGSILPGSGEYFLSRILNPGAIAKKPCLDRIPLLGVRRVAFLYGVTDWMDVRGGVGVRTTCRNNRDAGVRSPEVEVYRVPDAGHLLMLENPAGFHEAVVAAAAGVGDGSGASGAEMIAPDDAMPFRFGSPSPPPPARRDDDPSVSSGGDGGGGAPVAAR
mmetsp:Transcript_19631/g.45800  ORF Transcript_19631/g.45800 Transcript_19631/m.45800 type:complete len:466 (+) Transcript_19631:59-1456(+)